VLIALDDLIAVWQKLFGPLPSRLRQVRIAGRPQTYKAAALIPWSKLWVSGDLVSRDDGNAFLTVPDLTRHRVEHIPLS